MMRILVATALTAAIVVFGAQNWVHVPVYLLFGGPTRIRLVFLLLIAAGGGYVTAFLRGAGREVRLRREVRHLRRLVRDAAAREERMVVRRRRDEERYDDRYEGEGEEEDAYEEAG